MRMTGATARGIRMPIISPGDDLVSLVVDGLLGAASTEGFAVRNGDVIGVTEAVVAKAQGNFATLNDIARDVRQKFPEGELGLTFPILSRNRFMNILKGISRGTDKLHLLLSYPSDEVGNPIVDADDFYNNPHQNGGLMSADELVSRFGRYTHPFTGISYIDLYRSCGDNIDIWFSQDVTDILKLTPYVLEGSIHLRARNAKRLERAGAKRVFKLCDLLNTPGELGGWNAQFGVLGSNLSTGETLKLFPRDCERFVLDVQARILEKTCANVEVMVYGDGAFKDPVCGIWELADPVVSPAYTPRLGGSANEIKLKLIADSDCGHLSGDEKRAAVTKMIASKPALFGSDYAEGTTPRRFCDLLGSLFDLVSGSGDKGTPVVHVSGYFDDYSME